LLVWMTSSIVGFIAARAFKNASRGLGTAAAGAVQASPISIEQTPPDAVQPDAAGAQVGMARSSQGRPVEATQSL
jgi:hypothetical protein